MRTITIPGVATPLSSLILGSGGLSPDNLEHVETMLDAFLAQGGNTIDLAYIYGGGDAERAIGRWLEHHERGALNILTKGGHPDENGSRVAEGPVREELFTSLDRLGTDHVELYALHRDDTSLPVGRIVDMLNEHVAEGRVLALGASNWTAARIREANEYASAHGLTGFSFSSPNLSLAKANEPYWPGCVSADAETIRWHAETGLPLLSWSSQAGGFFSGRFRPDDRSNADMVRVFYSEGNWERMRRAERLAESKGVTPIQVSLAYVLSQPYPSAAIVGPADPRELESCFDAARIVLRPDEVAWLDLEAESDGD